MDTGKGTFEPLNAPEGANDETVSKLMAAIESKHPNHGGWFQVGEVVELKGSRFRVKSIKPDEIRLKLLRRDE